MLELEVIPEHGLSSEQIEFLLGKNVYLKSPDYFDDAIWLMMPLEMQHQVQDECNFRKQYV